MPISYAANQFSLAGANTQAELKTVLDATPANGMYEAGGAIFRNAGITAASGTSLTLNYGEVLVFDDALTTAKPNFASGSTLDFKYGGGITLNAAVSHSWFNGKLNGSNIVYRMNVPAVGGSRCDFFSPSITSDGLTNLTLVVAGGLASANVFTHLEPFAGKINGLNFINDVAGSGVTWNVQFGNGAYPNVVFAPTTSGRGFTVTPSIYFARAGGTSTLTNPTFRGSAVPMFGDPAVNGRAAIINEKWPDLAVGAVGTFPQTGGVAGEARTALSRYFEWKPGTLYVAENPVEARIINGLGTQVFSGIVTSAAAINLLWQNSEIGAQPANYNPFTVLARRKDLVDMRRTFTMVAAEAESFVLSPDGFYTNYLGLDNYSGIDLNATTKTITVMPSYTLPHGLNYTLDEVYDLSKYWLAQNAQMVSVPISFLSGSGKEMSIGDWKLVVQAGAMLSAGTKLTSIKTTGSITNSGTITCPYTSILGTVVRLTINGFPTGSDVVVLSAGTTTVLAAVDRVAGTSYDYVYTYNGAESVDIGIIKPGYVPKYVRGYALTLNAATLQIPLVADRVYQ